MKQFLRLMAVFAVAVFCFSGCSLFQRNEVEFPSYLKNEIPEPVAPDDGELAEVVGELDKPFSEFSEEELRRALASQRWLVRANAAAEAGKRMSEALYPELLGLLGDSLPAVRDNARWSLWKLTGLPWNSCESWCKRWVQHFKIDRLAEDESFKLCGVPLLSPEQTAQYVFALPLGDCQPQQFGGEETVVFRVYSCYEKALELKFMVDERYRVGEYLASGAEAVQKEGEVAWALLALRESKTGWAERSGHIALQAMTSNDAQFKDIVLLEQDFWDIPFSVGKKALQRTTEVAEETWLYCEQSLTLDVEGVLLLCGEDVLGFAVLSSASQRRSFYPELFDTTELAKMDNQLAALRKSRVAWLHQAAGRLRGVPLKEFLGRCIGDLSETSNAAWCGFIGGLVAAKVENCPRSTDTTWRQWQEWWNSHAEQLKWDDESGQFK